MGMGGNGNGFMGMRGNGNRNSPSRTPLLPVLLTVTVTDKYFSRLQVAAIVRHRLLPWILCMYL